MDPDFAPMVTKQDEQKLRELASGIIRGIEEPSVILDRLGFTVDDYSELSETRMFRLMLRTAQEEWEGAGNTHKRIKLKAAINIEEALPHFYKAMTSDKEPLSSKVKAFEVVSRVAGLGQTEQVAAGAGQFFKLEINLGGGVPPMTLVSGVGPAIPGPLGDIENVTIEHQELVLAQSALFDTLPLEDL